MGGALTNTDGSSIQLIVLAGINGEKLFALLKKRRLVHAVLAVFGGEDEQRDVPRSMKRCAITPFAVSTALQ
jgi:hypothetical protein